jgi:hypothetical protein
MGFLTADLHADGFIIPKPHPREKIPPLSVKYHRVSVEIINQVAKTSIDQVFINNHPRDIEGIYIFPLPEKLRERFWTGTRPAASMKISCGG